MRSKTTKAKAVLISDIHYRVETLHLADAALRQAIDKAADISCPVYILGDLNDTKAIIRGEVANALIETAKYANEKYVDLLILSGNHDMLNEKSSAHALNFLRPYAHIIDEVEHTPGRETFIPYQATPEAFKEALKFATPGSFVFMHQGVKGALMGDYVIDHSAVDVELLAPYHVFSGHYHAHQTTGTVTYIGSPYSITAAEAQDGPKGFLVLYEDGSFEQVPTNLRKHVTVERTIETALDPIPGLKPEDVLWIKVKGPYSELEKLNKRKIGQTHFGHSNFKLDKIVTEAEDSSQHLENSSQQLPSDLLDGIIDKSTESETQKTYLKQLWRRIA
jgi:DNA repair exonuclease SbcCD nuclease subunit